MTAQMTRLARTGVVALLLSLGCDGGRGACARDRATVDTVVVKDWVHDTTRTALGFNHLAGNVGAVNKDGVAYLREVLECGAGCASSSAGLASASSI